MDVQRDERRGCLPHQRHVSTGDCGGGGDACGGGSDVGDNGGYNSQDM